MTAWSDTAYEAFFRKVNEGRTPYRYQVEVARRLAAGENVMLGAPTGAGKTLAVLTPFFYEGWRPRPYRLIYALPLRTLAQSIYREARSLAARCGEAPEHFVTMQTGEQPDDEFFARGRLIVTTYDQVLSGLLGSPYGLAAALRNLNTAAVVGALVVFDEFHLMAPSLAFLTAAAGLSLFSDLAQCVWMTATATPPLRRALAEALGCTDTSPDEAAISQLPMVAQVTRRLTYRDEPLTPEAVLAASRGRTIVICNTVARAQALYIALRAALPPTVPCLLLHSRFFRSDRAEKERRIAELFGPLGHGRAVLVATQVVEAGLDISCDALHTELCPMNALIQRAGRCARYPGEAGTVYVYGLPTVERAWLPYGSLTAPDPALAATRELLASAEAATELTPALAARWVEAVHQETDAALLRDGWQARRREVLQRIRLHAIERQTSRVADLIREESVSDIRAIVAAPHDLPSQPTCREAITVSRWVLESALDAAPATARPVAWGWALGDEPHWEPITSKEALKSQYVVCLAPAVARYTPEVGLEVGRAGAAVSPARQPPPRPGHHPLTVEGWARHALHVARAARARLEEEDATGWLSRGFARRYALTAAELRAAVEACGLLHDLGKLQTGWQAWAAAWQQEQDPTFQPVEALAHTTYDPDNRADRERLRAFQPKRPTHAAQGAYLALAALGTRFQTTPPERRAPLIAAVAAAILAHHGGWLPEAPDLSLQPLWRRWSADLQRAAVNGQALQAVQALLRQPDRRLWLQRVVDTVTGPDALGDYWPLVAYLVRTLRLADQRATAEAGSE
ncbi:MAG TPA: CRISPR-associated helicase Cas3' [Chloroflexota bacterium]|nr:CRISPR-associated helicase Cas3' [Chloroflexota bacterium]